MIANPLLKKSTLNAVLVALLLLAACSNIEEISIDRLNNGNTDDGKVKVTVWGNVTTETKQHSVSFSLPKLWDGTIAEMPEIESVSVICEADTFKYIPSGQNVYISENPFCGQAGKTYKLVVETSAGEITAEDYLQPLSGTDYFQLMKDNLNYEQYQSSTGKTKYNFQFPKHIYTVSEQPAICGITYYPSSANCPIDSLNEWTFVHSEILMQALFSSQIFYYSYQENENSLQNHSEDFITCSVSPVFYEYLNGVFSESDWSLGILATIPGNAQGNVTNGYGYFFASDISRRTFTFNELISEND